MSKDPFSKDAKQSKADSKKAAGKDSNTKSQTGMPKVCPSCRNPRWDKTPRKS